MIGFLHHHRFSNPDDEIDYLGKLYRDHYKLWCYKVHQLLPNGDIEDVIHDAFVSIVPHCVFLKTLEKNQQLAYISKALQNAALKHMRTDKRVFPTDELEEYIAGNADDPAIIYERQVNKELFFKALDSLPLKQRSLIIYKFFEKLPDNLIADILDIQPASLRSMLARARQALRKKIEMEDRHE